MDVYALILLTDYQKQLRLNKMKKLFNSEKNNGFTLIELLFVFAFFIIYVIQIKIIAADLFKDLGFKDYSLGFFSTTLILGFVLTFFVTFSAAFSDNICDKKNIFFKFLSIILALTSISLIFYCLYHSRDSIFFIVVNIFFGFFILSAWRSAFFEKRQKLKKERK